MKKIFTVVAFSFFLMLSGLNAQNQLNTVPPLNGGNGNAGITFNLSADRGVVIDTIFCTFTGTGTTEIWYNTSPINGAPTINAANGWSQLATGITISNAVAAGSIVAIPVDLGLIMTPGDTFGIYVSGAGIAGGAPVAYTTYNTTNTSTFSDGFITIETGPNVGYGGGLPSPGFTTRQFNGGVKYTPLGGFNDAAVLSVDSPSVFCAGTEDVVVTIANFGINQIDSVDIVWEVNSVAQPTFTFRGTLDTLSGTGSSDTTLNIGSATFVAGVNVVNVYTTNPNGGSDTTNYNDTVVVNFETALRPTVVDRFNPTLTSIDIDVNNVSNQLDYEYGVRGFARGTGISGSSSVFPFTITGLTSGTEYDIYVRNNCGGGDTSLWVGPRAFLTSYSIPYFQDFQSFSAGTFQNPWPQGYTSQTTTPPPGFNLMRWESESANGFNSNSLNTGPVFDHTLFGSTGGRYIYFEAGFTFTGNDTAAIYTPPIEIPATEDVIEVSYWYFNYGSEIDRLEVHVDTNGVRNNIATYFGPQQLTQADEWKQEVIYLRGYEGSSLRLNFTGFATFDEADLAIDDIRIDTVADLNASLQEIIAPSGALCPGAINPIVALRNRGVNDLTSVDVVTDVNGTLDTTNFTFAALQTGDSIHLTLPSTTFSSGITYDLSYYVINPNNGNDAVAEDDTLSLNNLVTGLAGAITIDPSLPASATNYTTFNSFSNTVSSVGVCGAVTVTVAAGTYTDNIRLLSIPGTSPTDRLIIDGVSPDSVTLIRGSNNVSSTVVFENTEYVTIKNMTIRNLNTAGAQYGVYFTQNSQYDSIIDCRVEMSSTATFNVTGIGASSLITNRFGEGNNANNVAVIGCTIDGGQYSIHFEGGAFGNPNTGNSFIDNDLLNFWQYGLYSDEQDLIVFNGNLLRSDRNAFSDGVWAQDWMNFDFIGNDMIVGDWAVYFINANSGDDPIRESQIINNMIVSTGANSRGIYITNPLRINMYHNSVRHLGTTNPAVEFTGFGFIDSLDVRNNIFSSENTPAFEMNGGIDTVVFLKYDNNAYYTRGTDLITMGAVNYSTLSAYQVARPGFNISSVEGNPSYASDSNLRVVGVLVNDIGDNGVNVLVDIDGDPRPSPNATFVDPGADEFDPPACPAPINFDVTVEGPDSMTVYWLSGTPGSVVEYNWLLSGNAQGTGDLDSATVDTAGIGSLVSNTLYDVYIREICRRGDTSLWVGPITIETPCAPFLARNTQNYDAMTVGETPDCWTEFKTYNEPNAYVQVQNNFAGGNGYSAPNSVAMYSWFNYNALSDTLAGISPQFPDMTSSNTEINFWANTSSLANDLYVMTTDQPDGSGTFTMIDTVEFTTVNTWEENTVEFTAASGYNGTDEYIVMAHSLGQTFSYVRWDNFIFDTIPSCRAPRDLVATNITADSASLGWANPSGATSWEVEIDTAGFTLGSGFDTVVTTNPARFGDLLSNQVYEYRVRAICGTGDTSLWTTRSEFKTNCDPFTRGYFVDFDDMTVDQPADCWFGYASSISPNATVQVDNGFAANNGFSSPNALVMYSWNPLTDSMFAISPQFSDMSVGDKSVTFQTNTSNILTTLIVGTSDGQAFDATFTPLDTFTFTATNTWQEETVFLDAANGYNGTDEYVQFRHGYESSFTYLRIDDVSYDTIVSCPKPRALLANDIGTDSALLAWTNPSGSTTWEIEIGVTGFVTGTGTDTIVTSNPFDMPDLMPNTRYEYQVRSICAAGDTSLWSNRLEFVTLCVPDSSQYFTDFDDGFDNEIYGCWAEYNSVDPLVAFPRATARVQTGFNATQYNSASNSLVINSWTGNNTSIDTVAAISPEFLDLPDGDKRIRFHAGVASINNELIIATSDGPDKSSNYTTIDTISFTTANVMTEYEVELTAANGYNGTDKHVVLAHSMGQTFSDIRVDDFYYETIPTCKRPFDVTSDVFSTDSVEVSWTERNTATEWEISYGPFGFDADTGTKVIANGSAIDTLTGLMAGTRYDWYVRAICVVGDTSFWSNGGSFVTECALISAPYFNGFESDIIDSLPICWSGFSTVANNNGFVSAQGPGFVGAPRTGDRSLVLYYAWQAAAGDRVAAVAPQTTDITAGDKRIRFWLNGSNALTNLIVGTAVDQTSLAALSPLDTLTIAAPNLYEEFTVDITTANGYNGTDEFIVLSHDLGATFSYLRIDDFDYEDIPSCVRPTNLDGTGLSGDSAEIAWNEVNTATEWEVSYGLPGFDLDTGIRYFTTNNPDTISGLESGTSYQYYIRSVCAVGDTSRWSKVGSFQTECDVVTAPYFNGFENDQIDSIPICWNAINTLAAPQAFANVEGPGFVGSPRTGDRSFVMYGWNGVAGTDRMAAVTPELSDLTFNDKRVRFWVNSSDFNNGSGVVIGTSTTNDANGIFTPMDTLIPATQAVWERFTVEFTAANGYNGVDKFVALEHNFGNTFTYVRIDDFEYESFLTCIAPNNVTTYNTSFDTTDISWTVLDSATQWEVEYGTQGYNVGSGTSFISNSDTTSITGLSSATYYDVYVRGICGPGDTSRWSTVSTFLTNCDLRPITLPFVDDWETISGTIIGNDVVSCDTTHYWTFETNGPQGRLRYGTNAFAKANGSAGAVTMDIASGNTLTANRLILTLDLSLYAGSQNMDLSFYLRDHTDERDPGDRIWARGSSNDPWVEVFNVAQNATAVYTKFTVDLYTPLSGASQDFSSTFQIAFGQEDDGSTPNDGVSFDSIYVDGTVNTVGINKLNASENTIKVYPNPSNGYFTLNINTISNENYNMIVRDVKGQAVYSRNVSVNGTFRDQLDLTGLSKGIYFLQIQSENDTKVEKLIIQ